MEISTNFNSNAAMWPMSAFENLYFPIYTHYNTRPDYNHKRQTNWSYSNSTTATLKCAGDDQMDL